MGQFTMGRFPDEGEVLPLQVTCEQCGHTNNLLGHPMYDKVERLSLKVADSVASVWFPVAVAVFVTVWIAVNVFARPFAPFPMVMLGAISAVLAVVTASYGPMVLLAQRRAALRAALVEREILRTAVHNEGENGRLRAQIDQLSSQLDELTIAIRRQQ